MNIIKGSKGLGLIEVIIASVVSALIAVTGATLPSVLKGGMISAEERFHAIDLASSQIEELREIARVDFYSDPELIAGTDKPLTLDVTDIPVDYTITYDVIDRDDWDAGGDIDYKEITATCTYSPGKQISFKTYITE